jgi:hypothetical protein
MNFYSRFFHPGLKIAIFSPGFVVPVGKPGLQGGYEPGVKTPSPPVRGGGGRGEGGGGEGRRRLGSDVMERAISERSWRGTTLSLNI